MIRLSKSVVGPLEKAAVVDVLERGYLGMGVDVQQFEADIREYLGGEVTVACVSTGTAALQLAVQAIGCGPGDEVLVPSLTYVASFQAIAATGAVPVACDIRADSGLLDLADAETRVTARTKAVMPVHYASEPGDLDAVYAFAERHRLRVVEDAAHAFGCTYRGRKIGSFGDVVCFSFDGIKNITSGEGGAVVTRDPEVSRRVQDARLLGVEKDTEKRYSGDRSWEFDVTDQGWRYHMSNLMAAIGRVQLSRFEPEFKPKRLALVRRYREQLVGTNGLAFFATQGEGIVAHILPVRVLDGKKDRVREALQVAGIQSGLHYFPNHLLTRFRRPGVTLPVTERVLGELVTLPLHPELTDADVDHICATIRAALAQTR